MAELPPEPAPSQSPPVVASRQLVKPIKPNVASKPINKKVNFPATSIRIPPLSTVKLKRIYQEA